MRKFTINCDFGGQMSPFTVYIGSPKEGYGLIHHQADWLSKNRGGVVPGEVMEAFDKVQQISLKNGTPPEELCSYILDEL